MIFVRMILKPAVIFFNHFLRRTAIFLSMILFCTSTKFCLFFFSLLFSLWGTAHIFVIFLVLFSFSHIHPFFFKRSLEIRFQMPIVLKERPPYHQLPIKSAVFTSVTFVNLEKLLKVFQLIIYMEAQNVFLFRLQKLGTETGKSTSLLSLMLYFIKLKNMKRKII